MPGKSLSKKIIFLSCVLALREGERYLFVIRAGSKGESGLFR